MQKGQFVVVYGPGLKAVDKTTDSTEYYARQKAVRCLNEPECQYTEAYICEVKAIAKRQIDFNEPKVAELAYREPTDEDVLKLMAKMTNDQLRDAIIKVRSETIDLKDRADDDIPF